MKIKSIIAIILALSFLTACGQATSTVVNPTEGSKSVTPTIPTTSPLPTAGPTAVPTEIVPTPTKIPVDLTPAQMAAIEAVSKKYTIPVDQIKLVSTEAVSWPNGCLGVVIPGVLCTDVIVDGYRVILEAKGQQFEIHTNQDGTNVVDAAQLQATLQFVVRTSAGIIQVVNPNIPLGPTYNPAFNGLLPNGISISGTSYVLDFTDIRRVVAIDANGSRELSFIKNPSSGLAIWRGGLGTTPLLAWGTQLTPDTLSSSLEISAPDGSQLETLLTIDSGDTPGSPQIVAEFWSLDGKFLYFSEEPIGLGGYIPFNGASSLFKIDISTKEVTEIIPLQASAGRATCLDAISGDYQFLADHCAQNVITIRDLHGGGTATINPPAEVTDFRLMGSARFSPAGDQVAFAMAKGSPDDERGWVAVGSSAGGESRLVLVGDNPGYYTVTGWLNDQTLLLQFITTDPNSSNQIFTVGADGSNLTKVADGVLLTIVDNR